MQRKFFGNISVFNAIQYSMSFKLHGRILGKHLLIIGAVHIAQALAVTPPNVNHQARAEHITLHDLGPLTAKVLAAAERYGLPIETER